MDQMNNNNNNNNEVEHRFIPLYKQSHRYVANKRCHVCGDLARSFNYNGMCCEPCKVFFRRNWFKKLNCTNPEQLNCCIIDRNTRSICSACRLRKCFNIGMDANRIKFANGGSGSNSSSSSDEDTFTSRSLTSSPSSSSSTTSTITSVRLIDEHTLLSTTKHYFLSDYEHQHINQLQQIARNTIVDETKLPLIQSYAEDNVDLLNQIEIYLHLMIRFCKKLSAFCCLSEDTQLQVIKKQFQSFLLLRGAFLYDPEHNTVPTLMNPSTVQLVCFDRIERFPTLLQFYQKCMKICNKLIDGDDVIRNLLWAIIIFTPRLSSSSLSSSSVKQRKQRKIQINHQISICERKTWKRGGGGGGDTSDDEEEDKVMNYDGQAKVTITDTDTSNNEKDDIFIRYQHQIYCRLFYRYIQCKYFHYAQDNVQKASACDRYLQVMRMFNEKFPLLDQYLSVEKKSIDNDTLQMINLVIRELFDM